LYFVSDLLRVSLALTSTASKPSSLQQHRLSRTEEHDGTLVQTAQAARTDDVQANTRMDTGGFGMRTWR
jgi:hypothetical protein